MVHPLVTAIVPVYNGERFIAATLESVFAQDYRPLEVIVVDDGSTDGTAAAVRSFDGVHYLRQTNQGPSGARNTGIAGAAGEFLAFLDADDRWLAGKLRVQIGHHLAHPDIGYSITKQRIVLDAGAAPPAWLPERLRDHDHVGYFPSTLVARASAFAAVGPFNPEFRTGEGVEWFSRAQDHGMPMAIIEKTLLEKRVHDSNLSHQLAPTRTAVLSALKASIDRKRSRRACT